MDPQSLTVSPVIIQNSELYKVVNANVKLVTMITTILVIYAIILVLIAQEQQKQNVLIVIQLFHSELFSE
jgi:hypothetical protein